MATRSRAGHLFLTCYWTAVWMLQVRAAPTATEKGYIGITIVNKANTNFPTVAHVFEGGPAAEAKVQSADEILAVDNVSAAGKSVAAVRASYDGPAGSTVRLTLRRADSPDFTVTVTRRAFIEVYQPAATAGDPLAADALGRFYERASPLGQDLPKAVEWYRKAAEGNHVPAQVKMGDFLAQGTGVARDAAAAAHWYEQAAKQGNARAQSRLAYCYQIGDGVPQSDRSAFLWFDRSARQDDTYAETNLASCYREGRGVAVDDHAAFAWYHRAAKQNDPYGEWGLAYMYGTGRGTARDEAEALKWYLEAQKNLPDDQDLKNAVRDARWRVYARDPRSLLTLNLSALPEGVKRWVIVLFVVFALFYFLGGGSLLYFSFRAGGAPAKLPLALGWASFFLEGQVVAILGLSLLGTQWSVSKLLSAVSVVAGLPLIISSCGPIRSRLWKPPALSARKIALYSVAALASIVLVGLVFTKAHSMITHSELPGQPTLPLLQKANTDSVWLTFLSVVLLLPAAEEIIFRGYLFDAARRHLSNRNAIGITALAFAAMHGQWLYFLPLVGLGLIFGWLRLRTGSLWLSFLIHAVNNGVALWFAT